MRGRSESVYVSIHAHLLARVSGGETYDLVQTLRGTETSRAGADDEDIDIAGSEISDRLRRLRARLEQ